MTHPMYELTDYGLQTTVKDKEAVVGSLSTVDQLKHTGRLVPIYPETKRLTSKGLRLLIKISLDNLEELPEPIPPHVLAERNFPEINAALRQIHFPENLKEARIAKKRFAFEDLFLLQLVNIRQRLRLSKERAHSFPADILYLKSLLQKLPFELTKSQKVSLWDILKDLEKPHPMNRLLQGDVGSGKTIVSALAAILVAKEGKQSAFMAPTEVLARQHYLTFKKFFPDFDGGVSLLTSGEARVFYGDGLESEIKKTELERKIDDGKVKIIIGTHALIAARGGPASGGQKNIKFQDLTFVVVDEQHRFGVRQRAELSDQSPDYLPHFLSMSATPIPRTLTLTIFGDLDLSIIDELPSGRKKIITKIVAPANREKAYAFIRGQVKKGRQAFVICPRIEKEEDTEGRILSSQEISRLEMKNVKEEYEKLSKKIFPDLRVGLLHGKLKSKEKARVMIDFKEGKIDILVSTSVVEVGVDVPNATIMMIEGSDWFGLAQLYQFRGRVGRGEHQSFCFLFTDSRAKSTFKRLHAIINAKSGFELAEMDLEIRGPGEFLGGQQRVAQTGLPDLAMKAVQNPDLVKSAREAAETILNTGPELKKYPLLFARLEGFEKEIHLE
ncbi:MAG: ATP-dependent DNA helicase RecG, partial [Parcubacteria group bacterium]|nr:ATP-dependent DNA helicase RecG [Parcubacteria group bacterium]